MPRALFDQVLVAPAKRRSRPWVTVGSVLLHIAALLALFVWPLTAAVALPGVHTPLPAMMLASTELPSPPPEVTPPPPTEAPTPIANPDAAPVEAPDAVLPEVDRPPVSTVPPVPGGLPGAGSASAFTGLLSDRSLGTGLQQPPPPPVPPAPRRVGGEIEEPARIVYKAPVYPQIAVSARVEGTVILEATIDAQGLVKNVTVLKSVPLLDRAAIEAVQQWRYTPTRLNGQAIPIIMTVTVTFSVR
jgi:protein TonB